MHHQCTAQAAFLVSATFTGGSPLGSQASSESTRIKRLLPIAAAPAAMAGLAAAFALGNAPAAAHSAAGASGHHPAATAANSQAAAPQTEASAAQLLSITQRPTAGAPVVRLNATQVAAIQPKGKHHRTATAKYVVKSGDTLASIAQRLYHSPDYWTVLYWANHGAIKYASEIQAGSYLLMDTAYAKLGLPFRNALTILPLLTCYVPPQGPLYGQIFAGSTIYFAVPIVALAMIRRDLEGSFTAGSVK